MAMACTRCPGFLVCKAPDWLCTLRRTIRRLIPSCPLPTRRNSSICCKSWVCLTDSCQRNVCVMRTIRWVPSLPPSSHHTSSDPQRLRSPPQFPKCDSEERERAPSAEGLPRKRRKEKGSVRSHSRLARHLTPHADHSFLIPHAALLSNDIDPSLVEHFSIPSVALMEGVAAGPAASAGLPPKPAAKGQRKVSISSCILSVSLSLALVLEHRRRGRFKAKEKGCLHQQRERSHSFGWRGGQRADRSPKDSCSKETKEATNSNVRATSIHRRGRRSHGNNCNDSAIAHIGSPDSARWGEEWLLQEERVREVSMGHTASNNQMI
jgi:hypothetical protein